MTASAGHADEVLFAFIALVLGLITKIFLAWTHVPYTVIMLVTFLRTNGPATQTPTGPPPPPPPRPPPPPPFLTLAI